MSDWNELLARLADTPRENGSAALHQTAAYLRDTLDGAGVAVELVPFTAQPYVLRLAGVVALVGGVLYLRFMRQKRHSAALAVAIAVPALLLAQLDFYVPLFGWVGAGTQDHVLARIPAETPVQKLIFTAHYDSKTDVLDHVERAPVDLLAVALIPLMIVGALAARFAPRFPAQRVLLERIGGAAGVAALIYGIAAFVALAGGAFVPSRSPGALDDGASCAVLTRLATVLANDAPLRRTDVEVVLLSGEEVGVQGSWEFARSRFTAAPEQPTFLVNLEGIGASGEHAVLGSERFALRSFAPDPVLVERLSRVHRAGFGSPLEQTFYGGATDARSFLAHGIPAATLISREPGQLFIRGLHSARDARDRVDEVALERSLVFLLAFVRDVDAHPFPAR